MGLEEPQTPGQLQAAGESCTWQDQGARGPPARTTQNSCTRNLVVAAQRRWLERGSMMLPWQATGTLSGGSCHHQAASCHLANAVHALS